MVDVLHTVRQGMDLEENDTFYLYQIAFISLNLYSLSNTEVTSISCNNIKIYTNIGISQKGILESIE